MLKVKQINPNGFMPNWATPPGRTISDIMTWRGLSASAVSRELNMNEEGFASLLTGASRITPAVAQRLSRVFGSTSDFWLSRDSQYCQDLASQTASYDEWIASVPLQEMNVMGWVSNANEAARQKTCLEFFGYSDAKKLVRAYQKVSSTAYYRTSKTFVSFPAPVAAWLRQGSKLATRIACADWEPQRFKAVMTEVRALTRNKNPRYFIPKLQSMCAGCGVAVVVLKAPILCKASGATLKLDNGGHAILLSARYLSDDHFWFTFFHEAGHVLLHQDRNIIIDEDRDGSLEQIEQEADRFAEQLIVPTQYSDEFGALRAIYDEVLHFANKIGIAVGLVVGQLQHKGLIEPSYLNKVKRWYKWEGNELVSR